jgi:tetratricopeptide (TPR) repeat protein
MKRISILFALMAVIVLFAFVSAAYAEDAQTLYIAGVKKIKTRDFEKAIADFDKAIAANKAFVKAYVGRGMCNFMLDKHKQAISDLNMAIQRDPENVTALFWRGSSYMMAGYSKEAISDFTGVLKKQPENSWSYMNRGICQFRQEKLDEAIADASKAVSYNPKRGDPYAIRALCYYKKGKFDSAARDLKYAVEVTPTNAYFQLLSYTASAKNGDTKTDDLQKFNDSKDAKTDKFVYQLIGLMLGKVTPEECLKAADAYQPAQLKGTMVQQAQFFISNYFSIKGDKEKAKKYLDLAMNGENKLFVMQAIVKIQYYELKDNIEKM